MQILVTGGSGFLGLEIVKQLLALHYQVISINRNFSKSLHDLGVVQHLVDLSDSKLLHPLQSVGKVDAVFHNAAKAGVWGNYGQYFSSNFLATKNILDWSLLHGVKHFIYTSTPSVVYGESSLENADESLPYPEKYLSAYAQTKAMAEKLVLQSHKSGIFQTVAIRPHLIWGKDDPHIIPRLVQRAKCGRLIQVGNGHNLVDIIHVKNAAHAHLCALEYLQAQPQNGGKAYFVGQERPIPLWWFICQILKLKKLPTPNKSISLKWAYHLGRFLEILYGALPFLGEPAMTRFIALQLGTSHYFNQSAALNDLAYRPMITIEQALKELA